MEKETKTKTNTKVVSKTNIELDDGMEIKEWRNELKKIISEQDTIPKQFSYYEMSNDVDIVVEKEVE